MRHSSGWSRYGQLERLRSGDLLGFLCVPICIYILASMTFTMTNIVITIYECL